MSNKKICKNCSSWGHTGTCLNEKLVDTTWPGVYSDQDGLSYYAYEDDCAHLNVGPLFGCIHFKQKEVSTVEELAKEIKETLNDEAVRKLVGALKVVIETEERKY